MQESARRIFRSKIDHYKKSGRAIVYIDKSGFAKDMPRPHGYAPRGQRCIGRHDWHAKGRVNVLGALCAGMLLTIGLTSSNVDSDIFNLWLEQDLIPKLPPRAVIVMDNATFHKRNDTQQMLQSAGYTVEYLPPYSPDLNPIEHKWAQAKATRRKREKSVNEIFKQQIGNQN